MWSALGVFSISVLYISTGVAWLISGSEQAKEQPFSPTDPYLAVLEAFIVISAPLMVTMMAALHNRTPQGGRTCSLAALAFMTLLAGTTIGIHFVRLTVGRRIELTTLPGYSELLSFRWPSVAFALDLLAWDLFMGLSMLFAAPSLQGGKLETSIRVCMILSGALCLAGLLGPALGDLQFQVLGILGYAGIFPVICLLLAILFARR